MANSRRNRFSFRRNRKKGENDTKTQISLEQGSGEYKEFIMDQKGMDEFEQERQLAGEAGLVQCDPFQPEDKWHEAEAAEAAAVLPDMNAQHLAKQKFHYDHTVERKQNKRILKSRLVDDVEAQAAVMAEATPTAEDDKAAETIGRRIPHMIHDDGVMVDEFVPKALEKYM